MKPWFVAKDIWISPEPFMTRWVMFRNRNKSYLGKCETFLQSLLANWQLMPIHCLYLKGQSMTKWPIYFE